MTFPTICVSLFHTNIAFAIHPYCAALLNLSETHTRTIIECAIIVNISDITLSTIFVEPAHVITITHITTF